MKKRVLSAILGLALVVIFTAPLTSVNSQIPGTGVWNIDGDFELPVADTGNHENECFTAAPWGSDSWGVEGATFSDPNDQTLSASRFARLSSTPGQGYMYGKETTGKWGLVRFIQGDAWGGSNCGAIPWNVPSPIAVTGRNLTLKLNLYRDMSRLLTADQSWIMFAINVWFNSPALSKRLVMDLAFHRECNLSSGCSFANFEDTAAYHYQYTVGETPHRAWKSWTINLNQHIDAAVNAFNLQAAQDTLTVTQLEFLIELKQAEGAASIDNFFLEHTCSVPVGPTPMLNGPANGTTTRNNRPTFTWCPVPNATQYELQLDTVNPPVTTPTKIQSPAFVPSNPLLAKAYFWRVRGSQPGMTSWSDVSQVRIASAFNAPPLRNRFTTTTPALTWNRVRRLVGRDAVDPWEYQIQVDDNPNFSSPEYNQAGIAPNLLSHTLINPLWSGIWYWRVRAHWDTGVWGSWATDTFIIDVP